MVPAHMCTEGGKAMHHLHSHMCSLDFQTEHPFNCGDDDSWDAVEEFVACGMHPPATGVGFDKVSTLMTPASKLRVPLPKFVAVRKDDEDDIQFLSRVELEAEGIVGSNTHPEHDACVMNLCNGGLLNRVFELAEVAYGPRSELGTKEHTEASKKRRMNAAGKNPGKRVRALGMKKVETVKAAVSQGKASTPQGKTAAPRGKCGLKRPSDTEVASA
jgi:hypothetical protein